MGKRTTEVASTGEALLELLADRGVDYIFGNAGTDFPSIIEGLSKAAAGQSRAPIPITVPHENLAVAMAHGAYLATGRPQAVMLHVNVGTANAICGLINAARESIPMLVAAGRTPIMEDDALGSRSVFIHWGQEMFDQAGMVREMVKWDYELRRADQIEAVVDRALTVAMSPPRGPVYLTMPREVLADGAGDLSYDSPSRRAAATAASPNAEAVARAASWLVASETPLIVTGSFGRNSADVPALAALAEAYAVPVVGYRARYLFLPSYHPMHLGHDPGPLLSAADTIIALDCDVPWIPRLHDVNPDAKVVHIGEDPLFTDYPMRSFRADLAIAGNSRATLEALSSAMAEETHDRAKSIAARRKWIAAMRAEQDEAKKAAQSAVPDGDRATIAYVAACLNKAIGSGDTVVTETAFPVGLLDRTELGTYFGTSPAGGLGWGLGAALGLKLGRPDRRVIAVIGDGSYMFGNPTPAHFVSAANDLPFLTVILNNAMWGAVRRATLSIYPEGSAAVSNRAPLTYLEPAPAYEKIVEASGGYGEKVERASDLPAALERALHEVGVNGRQAVLNVMTAYSDTDAKRDAKR